MNQPSEGTEDQPHQRARFESLLENVLPKFVALPAESIDAAIVEAQREIVEALGLDRSTLFSMLGDGSVVMTHGWHQPGVLPSPIGLSASKLLPWCLSEVQSGRMIVLGSLRELPPDAATDLPEILENGPKSVVAAPLRVGDALLGALTFESLRAERSWGEHTVKRLGLVASIFASALSRKQATEAMQEGELRLGLAAESGNLGMWTVDPDGIIWATPKAYEIYQVPLGKRLHLDDFLKLVYVEDRQFVQDSIVRAMGEGADFSVEYRIVLPDGAHRWIHARGRMQPGVGSRGAQFMGVSSDITAGKLLEADLRNSLAEIKLLKDRLQAESEYLNQEVNLAHSHDRIVGQSVAIRRALAQVNQVGPANTTVLLLGETGTGKELFASAIHQTSARRDRAMIRVNCGAIPAALIESELFGREKGAYTGALSKQIGRFELAHKSTLFLDEIGELPLDLQVRLLRVLEERQIERLGSPKPISVDFRLVAATHRDLEKAVAEGKFREDLYYRLNVFQIRVPPLRDRREDIPLLVRAFVSEFSRSQGKQFDSIDQASIDAMRSYDWPGNVRELRNVIERAVITATGTKLRIDAPAPRPVLIDGTGRSLKMDDVERAHMIAVLEKTGWRVRGKGGAAEVLDIKPTTLESRMLKLGIGRPA